MEHAADASAAEPDRLSELPDCLLHFILSLSSMGARRLVQTSILSRRWRHLWRDAWCLDVGPQEFESAAGDDLENWVRFHNFQDSLLLQHRTLDLDGLRMQVVYLPLDNWVHTYLTRYNPAVLDIHNHSDDSPNVLLRGMSGGTVLRRLTTLRLTGVTLCDGFEDLLGAAGCPVLEHLELRDCLIGFREVVASRTLRTLVVDSSNMSMNQNPLRLFYNPRIVAPGLASLNLVLLGHEVDLWEFQTHSLIEATVRMCRSCMDREFELLCGLRNVTRLEMSTFPSLAEVMEVEYEDDGALPVFHNLTTLILDQCCDLWEFKMNTPTLLEFFLLRAPNMEKLTLQNCTVPHLNYMHVKLPPSSKRMAERSMSMKMCDTHLYLKFVEIKHRKKDGDICGIIEYLLRASKNLQRSNIVLSEAPEEPWYQALI